MSRILVIRLGALGDLVLSFPAFAAIRAQHPQARIALLTTAPFAGLMARAPWFDAVLVDARPRWFQPRGLWRLARLLRGHDFIYDLQTSRRSSRYRRLAGSAPWSGIARGASHPHDNPARDAMHTVARQRDQLARAGIARFPAPDLAWLAAGDGGAGRAIAPPRPYALLVPGASPHRPGKRWPAAGFAVLAAELAAAGTTPVVVGTRAEAALGAAIAGACPQAMDLVGKTSLGELARLAAGAALAVGNDTGPMHLAAALGAPCLVLFGPESDPALTAPLGDVRVLRAERLAKLSPARVAAALPQGHRTTP